MALFQPNPNPTSRELRWFAGLWFPAFWGVVGLVLRRRGYADAAVALWVVISLLAIAGLASSAIIRPIYRAMMRVSYPFGWVLSHVVVAAAYFLVITPTGVIMRFVRDPMLRTFDRSVSSYWIPCDRPDQDQYFRQL